MKAWFSLILVLLGMAGAVRGEVWTLRMPEAALLPSYAKATYLSRMHERHGGSHLGMQEYAVNIPFVDGRKSRVGSWHYNVQANVATSIMDVGGGLDLRRDHMYDFSTPVTLARTLSNGDRLMLTAMPRYSGDAVHSSHAWDLGGVVDYNVKYSERLSYSVGVAVSPRFAEYAVAPYVFFNWQATPEWQVRMHGYDLVALYAVNDRLNIGPSLSCKGGSWMVSRPEGQRILRVRSLVAAMVAEYNMGEPGKNKRMFTAALGSTLATSAEICNRTARKEAIETHHYKPGLALSMEMDFRF